MSNLGERGNMLPVLQKPTPETTPPPVEAFKSSDKIFSDKKIKKKVEPVNEVAEVKEVAQEVPVYVPKPKKPRKKGVYSAEAKRRMEEGRRKGLETRRRNLAAKRARELAELQSKAVEVKKPPKNKVQKTMDKAKQVIQKGVQNAPVEQQEYEYYEVDNEPEYEQEPEEDPEANFNQFANFMDRYEKMKQARQNHNKINYNHTARSRVRPPLPKVRPPTPAQTRWNPRANPQPHYRGNPRPASNQAYIGNKGYNPVRQRRPRMNKETNNPFLHYFS